MWNPDPNIKYDIYDPPIKMPNELTEAEKRELEEGHEERMRIILESAKDFHKNLNDHGSGSG